MDEADLEPSFSREVWMKKNGKHNPSLNETFAGNMNK
jgi:hypothetical protein